MEALPIPVPVLISISVFGIVGGAVVILLFILWLGEGRVIPHFLTRLGRLERRTNIVKIKIMRMEKMQAARIEHASELTRLSELAMEKPENFGH